MYRVDAGRLPSACGLREVDLTGLSWMSRTEVITGFNVRVIGHSCGGAANDVSARFDSSGISREPF